MLNSRIQKVCSVVYSLNSDDWLTSQLRIYLWPCPFKAKIFIKHGICLIICLVVYDIYIYVSVHALVFLQINGKTNRQRESKYIIICRVNRYELCLNIVLAFCSLSLYMLYVTYGDGLYQWNVFEHICNGILTLGAAFV